MLNETLDILQQPRIQQRIESIKAMQDEAMRLILIKKLFAEIQKASKSIVDEIGGGIAITNLDEITTAFHNETTRNVKVLLEGLKDINLTAKQQSKIMADALKDSQSRLEEDFQTVRIRRPHDKVTVANVSDFPVTEEVDVTNFPDFDGMFKSLEKALGTALKINLPAPQVNVEAPIIHIPTQAINIPEADLEPLLEELRRSLTKLRTNNKSNPVFMRLVDLQQLLDKLEEIHQASRNVMLGFPGSIALRGIGGGVSDPSTFGAGVSLIAATLGDGSQTVTTAGTRIQLITPSTPCKWVVVTAKPGNVGTIYIGGSTIATARGKPLVNLQETEVKINDVSKVWMDADTNGDGCTFYYGS